MGAFSATTRIKQNRISVSGPTTYNTDTLLRQIYRTPCTQSYAAYQILSLGGIQGNRVGKYNLRMYGKSLPATCP